MDSTFPLSDKASNMDLITLRTKQGPYRSQGRPKLFWGEKPKDTDRLARHRGLVPDDQANIRPTKGMFLGPLGPCVS